MGVFNFYGLIAVITILVPNLMWAMGKKGEFTEYYNNKLVSVLEQIGRFGCFITMIINIPYTYLGIVVCVYLIGWIAKGEKEGVGYALWLSIAPSVLFLVDGILILSIPLIVFAVIFAPCHILISYKNAYAEAKKQSLADKKNKKND